MCTRCSSLAAGRWWASSAAEATHCFPPERVGYWFRDASVLESTPSAVPPEPPTLANPAATPRDFSALTEVERYAVLYPYRAARIRANLGLPANLDFGPPEPDIVEALVDGASPSPMQWPTWVLGVQVVELPPRNADIAGDARGRHCIQGDAASATSRRGLFGQTDTARCLQRPGACIVQRAVMARAEPDCRSIRRFHSDTAVGRCAHVVRLDAARPGKMQTVAWR